MNRTGGLILVIMGCLGNAEGLVGQEAAYEPATAGIRSYQSSGGFSLKMLVDESNLGDSALEIGEVVFPAGSRGGEHRHGSTEILYILEGELEHTVNGRSYRLVPGMVGIVRAGDRIIHHVTSEVPVRAIVVWTPAGEAGRIAGGLREVPIEETTR
jgi:quercetin dioxygenase-like cupin family protein